MKRKVMYVSAALIVAMTTPTSLATASGFVDVPENSPYASYINDLKSRGIVNGVGDGKFAPGDELSRAEFAKFLVAAFNVASPNAELPFGDAHGHWAQNYIASVYVNGIAKGTSDTSFEPNTKVTRQEAATMLWRYLSSHGVNGSTSDIKLKQEPSDWAHNGVTNMVALNLFGPEVTNDANSYDYQPLKVMTRQEMAAMISKALSVKAPATSKVVDMHTGTFDVPVVVEEGTSVKVLNEGKPSRTTTVLGLLNPTREQNNLLYDAATNTYKFGNIARIYVSADNGTEAAKKWSAETNPKFGTAADLMSQVQFVFDGSQTVTFKLPDASASGLTWKYREYTTIENVSGNSAVTHQMRNPQWAVTLFLDTSSEAGKLFFPVASVTLRNKSLSAENVQLQGFHTTLDIN